MSRSSPPGDAGGSAPGPIGGHATTAGGLARGGLRYLDAVDAAAVQVYVSNPRGWAQAKPDPEQDAAFLAGCRQRGIPVFIHAALLINLGSPTEATVERSAATLRYALRRGLAIGARAVVFHAGSSVTEDHDRHALGQVRRVLLPILDEAAEHGLPRLLVEPSAGGGRGLASRVDDLAGYLDALDRHPHLGVCFDTCHAWAAGHDLASPGGMATTLDALVAAVGPGRLELIHANDSRDDCGSARDRHASIGTGSLGEAPFAELLAHPAARGVPIVVETPNDGPPGHRADIATLRRLMNEAALSPATPR